jgi:hypothetical protein
LSRGTHLEKAMTKTVHIMTFSIKFVGTLVCRGTRVEHHCYSPIKIHQTLINDPKPQFSPNLNSYEHHPLKVGAAFLRHEPKFYLYALYNKNKPKSDSLMSEYGSAFFKSKQIELNDKMDLASYLLKPVQRMGKYALLLQQLMKACSSVQSSGNQELIEDYDELQKAEEMVRFQLRHGNDLLAMDSLRDCDVNVKEQGRLLRQSEFLVWEGRGGKKSLRQVFLFEELVLFSKARRFPDRKVQ